MLCLRAMQTFARAAVLLEPPSLAGRRCLGSLRPFSIHTRTRPSIPSSFTSSPQCRDAQQSPELGILSSSSPDLLPKISSHPALAGTQVRNGPRNTYDPSHRVRKRRHGFLSRKRTRKGRNTLQRRQTKGRNTLSH